jgi:hypothetical protein
MAAPSFDEQILAARPRSSRNSAPDSDARYLGGVAAQAEPVEIGGQVLFKIMVVSFLPKT